jgi:hypothetical protein
MHHGVGGQFRSGEDRVVGGRTPGQVPGYRAADMVHLVGAAGISAGMPGGSGWFGCHAQSTRCHGKAGGAGGAAAVFADRLLQVRLERGELVSFGGLQVGSFGHQVNQGLHLLELRGAVQPD